MAKKYAKKTGSTKELKNLKDSENIERNWQSGNIREKQEVSGQNVWVGILLKCQKITVFLLINCDRWYAITTSSHAPCFAEEVL